MIPRDEGSGSPHSSAKPTHSASAPSLSTPTRHHPVRKGYSRSALPKHHGSSAEHNASSSRSSSSHSSHNRADKQGTINKLRAMDAHKGGHSYKARKVSPSKSSSLYSSHTRVDKQGTINKLRAMDAHKGGHSYKARKVSPSKSSSLYSSHTRADKRGTINKLSMMDAHNAGWSNTTRKSSSRITSNGGSQSFWDKASSFGIKHIDRARTFVRAASRNTQRANNQGTINKLSAMDAHDAGRSNTARKSPSRITSNGSGSQSFWKRASSFGKRTVERAITGSSSRESSSGNVGSRDRHWNGLPDKSKLHLGNGGSTQRLDRRWNGLPDKSKLHLGNGGSRDRSWETSSSANAAEYRNRDRLGKNTGNSSDGGMPDPPHMTSALPEDRWFVRQKSNNGDTVQGSLFTNQFQGNSVLDGERISVFPYEVNGEDNQLGYLSGSLFDWQIPTYRHFPVENIPEDQNGIPCPACIEDDESNVSILSTSGGFYSGHGRTMAGRELSLIDVEGTIHLTDSNDEQLTLGTGVGWGASGEIHNGEDSDGDGRKEYGGEISIGPFKVGYRHESG
jgi:hypothetical protein